MSEHEINDRYAIYHGDCCEVLPTLPDASIGLSVYSPPFADLYQYSSSEHDLGNNDSYEAFLEHYRFVVREIARLTMRGRLTAIHCADISRGGARGLRDFPGDIIRLHEAEGFLYHARFTIWKEPLHVAIRTRALGLAHRQLASDSSLCGVAGADFLIVMRKKGKNEAPIEHPEGLAEYAGDRAVPENLLKFRGAAPRGNKLSHWIWRQYASSVWDDIRPTRHLDARESRETDEERHVCPLQLDVIDRCLALWSDPGETVLTPFMGIGSEVYAAVRAGRRAIGIELKGSYFDQARRNVAAACAARDEQIPLFADAASATILEDERQSRTCKTLSVSREWRESRPARALPLGEEPDGD